MIPTDPDDRITLIHDGKIGDYLLRQVQLEEDEFTVYRPNETTESMLGATYRYIQELQTIWSDENGDMTRMTREGMRSTYQIYQDIQAGTSSETLDSDNGLYRLIKDTQTNSMNEFVQTSDLFASRIGEIIEDDLSIGTQISQTKDIIELAFFGSNDDQISKLAVGESGIYLNGGLIDLDGNARFNDAFVNNIFASFLYADEVTGQKGVFGEIIASYINVNHLTGNHLNFITGAFLSSDSGLYLSGTQLRIDSLYGWDLTLNRSGFSVNDEYGSQIGRVSATRLSSSSYNTMSINANRNSYAILGYQGDNPMGTYNEALSVHGTTGLVRLADGKLAYANSGYGIRLSYQSNIDYVYGLRSSTSAIGFGSNEVYFVINGTRYGLKTLWDAVDSLATRVNNMS